MTQFPGAYSDPTFDAMTPLRKTSGLAVAAMIFSCIFFCPLTTILGIILGVAAIVSIGSDPAKKGKGLAVAAIVLGLVFTIAQGFAGKLLYDFGYGFVEHTMQGPNKALKKGYSGDIAGFKGEFFGAGSAMPDADASAFIDTLRGRYGEFVSARFDERSGNPPQGKPGQPNVPFPYVLTFTNKTVNAEAELIFADQTTGAFLKKLGYIVVFDAEQGNVAYPPSATPTRPPPSRTGGQATQPGDTGPGDASDSSADNDG